MEGMDEILQKCESVLTRDMRFSPDNSEVKAAGAFSSVTRQAFSPRGLPRCWGLVSVCGPQRKAGRVVSVRPTVRVSGDRLPPLGTSVCTN